MSESLGKDICLWPNKHWYADEIENSGDISWASIFSITIFITGVLIYSAIGLLPMLIVRLWYRNMQQRDTWNNRHHGFGRIVGMTEYEVLGDENVEIEDSEDSEDDALYRSVLLDSLYDTGRGAPIRTSGSGVLGRWIDKNERCLVHKGFGKGVREREKEDYCTICMEVLGTNRRLTIVTCCGHTYHKVCYTTMLKYEGDRYKCPICRHVKPVTMMTKYMNANKNKIRR